MLLTLACGRVDYPDDSTTSSLKCFDGELRLAETPCATGQFLVERCEAEEWQATEECRAPEVPCDEDKVIQTEEICGVYEAYAPIGGMRDYNRVLQGCRGGVRQKVGCTCGAEGPGLYEDLSFETEKTGKLEGQIPGIEDYTYVGVLALLGQEVKTDLSHVLCVGWLVTWGPGLEKLTGITAINRLVIEKNIEPLVVPPFPALHKLYELSIYHGNNVDLSGLENITELGWVDIRTSADVDLRGLRNVRRIDFLGIGSEEVAGITSLEGLEGVTRAGSVGISPGSASVSEVPALLNYKGLMNLEYVEGRLGVRRSAEGLKGLESVRSVGSLVADIVDESDFAVLSNLEEVRGDIELRLYAWRLRCSVPDFLEHVNVTGTVTVDGLALEDLDFSSCE